METGNRDRICARPFDIEACACINFMLKDSLNNDWFPGSTNRGKNDKETTPLAQQESLNGGYSMSYSKSTR